VGQALQGAPHLAAAARRIPAEVGRCRRVLESGIASAGDVRPIDGEGLGLWIAMILDQYRGKLSVPAKNKARRRNTALHGRRGGDDVNRVVLPKN